MRSRPLWMNENQNVSADTAKAKPEMRMAAVGSVMG